jgi:NAD+ diphosphatase
VPASRFVPLLELPDDWSGAITVAVHQSGVAVLDDHPDDLVADVPRQVLGTLDGAACWVVDLDGDGVPDVVIERLRDGLVPLMGLHGQVEDVRWTLAGRAVQLVEWERTHRFCGRCGTPPSRRRATALAAAPRAGCSRSRGSRRR